MIRTGATDAVITTWTPLRRCVATPRQASENRLVEVIQPETTRCVFTYDHQGRRRTKKVYTWDTDHWSLITDYLFLYDDWNLVFEVITDHTQSPAEDSTKSYVWGTDLSGTLQGAGGVGGLLSCSSSSGPSFYSYDGNGNVVALVDSSDGTVTATYDYSPFGKTVSMSGSAAADNTFRFSTKYHDPETGLVYYGFRYYEPSLGRWVSRDPVGEHADTYWTAYKNRIPGNTPSESVTLVPASLILFPSFEFTVSLLVGPQGLRNGNKIRGVQAWLTKVREDYFSGQLYGAVSNSPIGNIDAVGAEVQICMWPYLDHSLLKSDECGSWGFGPDYAAGWPIPPRGKVSVQPTTYTTCSPVPGFGNNPAGKCREKHLCQAISWSRASPPNFTIIYNCWSWVTEMLASAQLMYQNDPCCSVYE